MFGVVVRASVSHQAPEVNYSSLHTHTVFAKTLDVIHDLGGVERHRSCSLGLMPFTEWLEFPHRMVELQSPAGI
jgi:hypothetical protein